MAETTTEIVTNTLRFIPQKIPLPITTVNGHLKMTINDIVTLLSRNLNNNSPTNQQYIEMALREAFRHIANLLNNNISPAPNICSPPQLTM